MPYLIQNDYKKLIQSDNLTQIIGSDLTILFSTQATAQAEAVSYLTQKYDTSKEFTNTLIWDITVAYKAAQRTYLDAPTYSATSTYAINSLTLQAGNVYKCATAITVPEVFTIAKWTLIGVQYSFYYVTLPKPEFNLYTFYIKGTQVFWKDKTYTCVISSVVPTHEALLMGGTYNNAPPINVFPDDPTYGLSYWGAGTAYILTAGVLPTDITKWTTGDNRNQQLVNYFIDITLYHLHSRVAPRNIPELRVKRYDDAIAWFKMAAGKGDNTVTADLPLLQPKQGGRIRWGGNIKTINQF